MAVFEAYCAKALTDKSITPIVLILLFLIFIATPVNIWSGDTVGTSVFLLNLVQHHTIYYDGLRHSDYWPSNAYFAAPAQNGHLANSFPIGVALVFGPLHLLFYAITTAVGYCPPADVFSQKAEYCRLVSDKWTSALLATASAGLYWRLVKEYVKAPWLQFASFVFFAIGTNVYMIASQSNWQQGATIFLSLCVWLVMLTEWPVRRRIVLLAVLGGLLVSTRPTNVFFLLPFVTWLVLVDRKRLISNALLGIALTLLFCPALYWNLFVFGNIEGGYSLISDYKPPFFFTVTQFLEGFSGLWFSPSHGLLIFTPVVALGCVSPLAIHPVKNARVALLAAWICAAAVIVVTYCFYREWWGGWSFGPRFLTDVIPPLSIGAAVLTERYKRFLSPAFITLGLVGCCNQFVGAFAPNNPATYGDQWDTFLPALSKGSVLWDWADSPLVRDYRAVYYKVFEPSSFAAPPQTIAKSAYCPLKKVSTGFEIENTGDVPWIGVSAGTGYPPSLSEKNGQHFRYYLTESIVLPGKVGLFASAHGPPNPVFPLQKLSMQWGGTPVRLKCDSRGAGDRERWQRHLPGEGRKT